MEDIYTYDKYIFKSLEHMKNNVITENEYGEMFTIGQKIDGKFEVIELKKDGSNIKVCEDNKKEFLELMINWFGYRSKEPL